MNRVYIDYPSSKTCQSLTLPLSEGQPAKDGVAYSIVFNFSYKNEMLISAEIIFQRKPVLVVKKNIKHTGGLKCAKQLYY